jgi:hypothetical protein
LVAGGAQKGADGWGRREAVELHPPRLNRRKRQRGHHRFSAVTVVVPSNATQKQSGAVTEKSPARHAAVTSAARRRAGRHSPASPWARPLESGLGWFEV